MDKVSELFGINVFNDSVMKEYLPTDVYKILKSTIKEGKTIDSSIADTVASAMKEWAISKGATHFTHWFQPLTGITAEKHDSFISPTDDGHIIMEFSGKELIKGEPDASSFPSGGLRATFEARGYTAWDPSSYAFVKDETLCIPTAFCSYTGEALDQKTPLLRSMDAINKQALRIIKLFGHDDVKRINATVGPEQEYFLVDKAMYEKRPDLIFCGRTLIGSMPPKGQEMDDHYFGVLKPRVAAFMRELDSELWKLGVLAKTEHNEAAPSQHELAPIFTTTNIAADHNQLTMEMMKKTAIRHGLVCLLHEKPFDGVNGSGKHNNWSLSTDTGINFLKPGKNPEENPLFLLSLAAVIKAVDEHQELLRISVATAGNDHRLGANEAPPAIISIFLGEELTDVLTSIAKGVHHDNTERIKMNMGSEVIPSIRKDNTDRNRTSPFAFTGNKFEFRMLGSASSISDTNVMLNTMVAEVFSIFADRLEKAEDFKKEINLIIKEVVEQNGRIIFNGDGYSEEWEREAEKRGLLNLRSTVDAIPLLKSEKNIEMFEKHKVLNRTELNSRVDIILENYTKILHIEALTLIDMMNREVIPAITAYTDKLCRAVLNKNSLGGINSTVERELIARLSAANKEIFTLTSELKMAVASAEKATTVLDKSRLYHDKILSLMVDIRKYADSAESVMPSDCWPYPSYGDLLFSI
ncbi:MAG: glutamine synthetase type III [Ruminococcaceae bacterium]|nr:glutamine synthetase type III [Oscillospiraceae bacterium]